ncbi:MAG: metallophosphoesterase [Bacteroidota bacterium]
MSLDPRATNRKLSGLWNDPDVKVLKTKNKKYALFSDLHLGDGGDADDFHGNEKAMRAALKKYYDDNYSLIFLGDIEEFWQFDYDSIVKQYNNSVYSDIRKFGNTRLFRVYGNHDMEWRGFIDPTKNNGKPSSSALEALKMEDVDGNVKLLLVHGHQGSLESDKNSWSSRFFVRAFRKVEPIAKFFGLYGEGSATKSQIPDDYEKVFYRWAKRNKTIIICGHSHRAIFASKSYADKLQDDIYEIQLKIQKENSESKIKSYLREIESLNEKLAEEKMKGRKIDPTETSSVPKPCYFNTGCGLYTDGITSIEIDSDNIRLVKWNNRGKKVEFDKGEISKLVVTGS